MLAPTSLCFRSSHRHFQLAASGLDAHPRQWGELRLQLPTYTTAVKGRNGFLCIVERSWGAATDDPDFWNPKVRAPICFSPPTARTFVPIFLMKSKLVLAGKSKTEIIDDDRMDTG
jgi:hypothetical protein